MTGPGWQLAPAAVGLVALVWVAGACLVPRGAPSERLVAGCLAIVGVAWASMAQTFVDVSLVSRPPLAWTLAATALAVALAWRRPRLLPAGMDWRALAACAAVWPLALLPAIRHPLGDFTTSWADVHWHRGMIEQLLDGRPEPGWLYADVPNGYPWLFHSLAAWLTPAGAGDVRGAMSLVSVFVVLAMSAGIWSLARELRVAPAAAGWAVLFAGGAGGASWLWAPEVGAVTTFASRTVGRYDADRVTQNPLVPAFANLHPALPRDLGVALVPMALALFLRGARGRSLRRAAAAGAALGFAFLASPVAGVVVAAMFAALAITLYARAAGRALAIALAAAVVVAAMWLAPLALEYVRYEGFTKVAALPPINPGPLEVLVAFGILSPLAMLGMVVLWRWSAEARLVAAIVIVPLAACLITLVALDDATSFWAPPLVRWRRYLVYLALALVVPAGIGARLAVARARRRRGPALAVGMTAAICVAALSSTALASVAVSRDGSAWRVLACGHGGPPFRASDTVAVLDRRSVRTGYLALAVFAQTGANAAYSPYPRVRFRTLFSETASNADRRRAVRGIALGGPVPAAVDWVLARPGELAANERLRPVCVCTYGRDRYQLLSPL